MQLKLWFQKKPAWLKGGLVGLGIYVGSVVIGISASMVGGYIVDKDPNFLAPGSLGFIVPFLVIGAYPAILFVGSYEAVGMILPLNLVFYFCGGALIGTVLGALKSK